MPDSFQDHWDNIYSNKQPEELSWTQEIPTTSLDFIRSFNLPKSARIIDIGGGDSKLVDYLLEEGYQNLTVLDISEKSLERAKIRLGSRSEMVQWIVSDVTEFQPSEKYDLWHDRAAFHFLTDSEKVTTYINIASESVAGYLTIGTFSESGPDKCSGLKVQKYSEELLQNTLSRYFKKLLCKEEKHTTPFNTVQNFLFCSFIKSLNNYL